MTTPTLLLQCMIGSCCIEERGDIVQIEEPATDPRGVVNSDDDISSSLSENRLVAKRNKKFCSEADFDILMANFTLDSLFEVSRISAF